MVVGEGKKAYFLDLDPLSPDLASKQPKTKGKRPLCLSSTGSVTEEGVSDGEKTERLSVWPAGDVDEGRVHGFLPFWCKPARLWAVCAPRAHMGSSRGAVA
ncbi:hypothetical protein ES332_D09G234500v1 [Gossypium tomentosum]|uniref:Uncharacterized protein n=1 Tax=Gossypium tomentosum TaxID=34277 RepID=A0A5D2JKN6_GOSTO|nr:hypothetical protein ES332_D09G234500v1 [Gossypium tomentosum]